LHFSAQNSGEFLDEEAARKGISLTYKKGRKKKLLNLGTLIKPGP
jgi:hypothetical protein